MRNYLSFLFLLFFLLFPASLVNAVCEPNGCGSGWSEKLVPDKFGFLDINFNNSCAVHDTCYSRCLECGENYNTLNCNTGGKSDRRTYCDIVFKDNMEDECKRKSPKDAGLIDHAKETTCKGLSFLYYLAVRIGGKDPFNGKEVQDFLEYIYKEGSNFDLSKFKAEMSKVVNRPDFKQNQFVNFKVKGDKLEVKMQDAVSLLSAIGKKKKEEITFYGKFIKGKMDMKSISVRKDIRKINKLDPRLNKLKEFKNQSSSGLAK